MSAPSDMPRNTRQTVKDRVEQLQQNASIGNMIELKQVKVRSTEVKKINVTFVDEHVARKDSTSSSNKHNSLRGQEYFANDDSEKVLLHERHVSQQLRQVDPFSPTQSIPTEEYMSNGGLQSSSDSSHAYHHQTNGYSSSSIHGGNVGIHTSSSRLEASSSGVGNGGLQSSSSGVESIGSIRANGGMQSSSSGEDDNLAFGLTVTDHSQDESFISDADDRSTIVGDVTYMDNNDCSPIWPVDENGIPQVPATPTFKMINAMTPFQLGLTRTVPLRARDLQEVENDPAWETIDQFTFEDLDRSRYLSDGTANVDDDSDTPSLRTFGSDGVRKFPTPLKFDPATLPKKSNGVPVEEYSKVNRLRNSIRRSYKKGRRHPFKSTPPQIAVTPKRYSSVRFASYENLGRGNDNRRNSYQSSQSRYSGDSGYMTVTSQASHKRPIHYSAREIALKTYAGPGRRNLKQPLRTRKGKVLVRLGPPPLTIVDKMSPYPKQEGGAAEDFKYSTPQPILPQDEDISCAMYEDRTVEEWEFSMMQGDRQHHLIAPARLHVKPGDAKTPDWAPEDTRKLYSRVVLVACIPTFFLLPIYAAGGLDGVLSRYTGGKVGHFHRGIRRSAWFVFVFEILLIIGIVTAVMVSRAIRSA